MSNNSSQQRKKHSAGKRSRIRVGTFIFGIISVLVAVSAGGGILVMFRPENRVAEALRRVFPFPIAVVHGTWIRSSELDRDRESLRQFYESQSDQLGKKGLRVDFNTENGKKRLLVREKDIFNKLIEDRVILLIAKSRGISFSEDEVSRRVNDEIQKESGDRKSLEERLRRFYGWSIRDFEDRVVRPSLYRKAVSSLFDRERDVSSAKNRIEQAASALRNGMPFPDAVQAFSDGDSKRYDGNVGWSKPDSLIPELREPAKTQVIGSPGSVIESSLGYHIMIVSDRRSEAGQEAVSFQQIFVRKPAFSEWIRDQKAQSSVWILSRRYVWDRQLGAVLFREPSLRMFEEEAIQEADGDPSLIF